MNFAIPGLMTPPIAEEATPAVLQFLDREILTLPVADEDPTVEVSILSRSARYLYRQGLEYTSLTKEEGGAFKTWTLHWEVDLPPNDYLLETRINNVIQGYTVFSVEAPAGAVAFTAPTPLPRTVMEAFDTLPEYTTYQVLDTFFAGDDFPGIPNVTIRIGGAPPTLPLGSVELRMVHDSGAVVVFTVGDGKITINSAAEWDFAIPPTPAPELISGLWRWSMPTSDTAGSRVTYLVGHFKVIPRL